MGRQTYIMRSLALIVLMIVSILVVGAVVGLNFDSESMAGGGIGFVLCSIIMAACTYSSLSFMVRRCHDLNKSGWWAALAFVPTINVLFTLYILFVKGTDGSNDYGSNPLL